MFGGLAHLLQFANRLIHESHFLKGHTEVVVGIRIAVIGGALFHFFLELGKQVAKHFVGNGIGEEVGGSALHGTGQARALAATCGRDAGAADGSE